MNQTQRLELLASGLANQFQVIVNRNRGISQEAASVLMEAAFKDALDNASAKIRERGSDL